MKPAICPKCGGSEFRVIKYINAGGHETYPYVCNCCQKRLAYYLTKKQAEILKPLDEYPIEYSENIELCDRCGAVGSEFHHYGPRHIFGSDSDSWGSGMLCQKCHALWHQKINEVRCASCQKPITELGGWGNGKAYCQLCAETLDDRRKESTGQWAARKHQEALQKTVYGEKHA